MSNEQGGFLAVDTGLVRQTLVETLFGHVEKLTDEPLDEEVIEVLEAEGLTFSSPETELEKSLRRYGYLARVVETDLFETARPQAEWARVRLAEGFAVSGDWMMAIIQVCDGLAASEPVDKPDPEDELAMTWKVPGPGGHVRHYLARRTIEDLLRERESPIEGDPADLKRSWLFGFFVRVCEETIPAESGADDD